MQNRPGSETQYAKAKSDNKTETHQGQQVTEEAIEPQRSPNALYLYIAGHGNDTFAVFLLLNQGNASSDSRYSTLYLLLLLCS